jgi:hypothetical protein
MVCQTLPFTTISKILFWDVTTCIFVNRYQRFQRQCFLRLHDPLKLYVTSQTTSFTAPLWQPQPQGLPFAKCLLNSNHEPQITISMPIFRSLSLNIWAVPFFGQGNSGPYSSQGVTSLRINVVQASDGAHHVPLWPSIQSHTENRPANKKHEVSTSRDTLCQLIMVCSAGKEHEQRQEMVQYVYSISCLDDITKPFHYKHRYHPVIVSCIYLFMIYLEMLSISQGYTVTSDVVISE